MQKQKVLVIVGPTASGKTSLAIRIAREFDGEVISADSRQVYRRLDIGTEKVPAEEMQGIPHHLLDVVETDTVYTAADFKQDAREAIEDIVSRNKLPIVAGGTFFYIDTLLDRVSTPEVSPDPKLREELDTLPTETLFATLERLDARRAQTIDPHNRRRLIRALEIIAALGYVPDPNDAPEITDAPYDTLFLGIDIDRDVLRTRIRDRAQSALSRGLIEETRELLTAGVSRERLSEIGLEYAVVMEYLDGNLTDDELIQKLEEKNWQYAKRQLTWLRQNEDIQWIDPSDSESVYRTVGTFLTDSSQK